MRFIFAGLILSFAANAQAQKLRTANTITKIQNLSVSLKGGSDSMDGIGDLYLNSYNSKEQAAFEKKKDGCGFVLTPVTDFPIDENFSVATQSKVWKVGLFTPGQRIRPSVRYLKADGTEGFRMVTCNTDERSGHLTCDYCNSVVGLFRAECNKTLSGFGTFQVPDTVVLKSADGAKTMTVYSQLSQWGLLKCLKAHGFTIPDLPTAPSDYDSAELVHQAPVVAH